MSEHQLLLANLVRTAVLLIVVGILVRRRAGLCWSFLAYLSAILIGNSLALLWPDQFFNRSFHIMKTSVYNVLKLCVAAELTYRVFRAFPGALARARLFLAPIVTIVAVGIISVPTGTDYYDIVSRYNPQVQTGVIWLLSATAVLAVWYNIPLHFFHRAVLLGFSSYLIVFATSSNLLRSFGFDRMVDLVNYVDTYAYLALVTWWTIAAWRSGDALEIAPVRGGILAPRPALAG
jgi:hypothetical protein